MFSPWCKNLLGDFCYRSSCKMWKHKKSITWNSILCPFLSLTQSLPRHELFASVAAAENFFGFILHPIRDDDKEETVHCEHPLLCSSCFKKLMMIMIQGSEWRIKACPDDNMSLNNTPNFAIYMKIEKKCCRRREKTINWDGKEISFACYEPRPFYWFLWLQSRELVISDHKES